MIIPKLWARLGNQAFMVACVIAHAKRMRTTWGVPHKTIDPRVWPTYFNNLPKAPRGYVAMHVYEEPRHCYDPLPLHSDMQISGYFQSEKYFADAKPQVREALGFNFNRSENIIAIHIRRGDYLQYPDQFPVLPIEYYQQAIEYFVQNASDQFIVYTDDDQYFFNEFYKKIDWYGAHVVISSLNNPLEAIKDMYNCSGFIVANSTFSLFPALLSEATQVVAPAEHRWYGPKNANLQTHDLMPERFIKL